MNLFIRQKKNHRYRKVMVTKGETGGRINQEFEINRYTLLYIKQIINKNLLYSTGNYIQYLIITYNGKNICVCIYIYIYMNHYAVLLKLTNCISTIIQLKKKKLEKNKRKMPSFPK